MSDETVSKAEFDRLKAQFETLQKQATDREDYLKTVKKSVEDLKSDREDLKKKLKETETQKQTEDASVEQLKQLIKEQTERADNLEKQSKIQKVKAKVIQKALERNFQRNSSGQINEKLLDSYVDAATFTEDDDGNLIGLDQHFDKLKESDPYLFTKPKQALQPEEKKLNTYKGRDVSSEAFAKAKTLDERVKIMKAREERNKDNTNNMLPGYGNAPINQVTET